MATEERQRSDRKLSICLKTASDADPWFSTTSRTYSRLSGDASAAEQATVHLGDIGAAPLRTDNDSMFSLGRLLGSSFTRVSRLTRLEILFLSYLLFSLYVFGCAITAARTKCATCMEHSVSQAPSELSIHVADMYNN